MYFYIEIYFIFLFIIIGCGCYVFKKLMNNLGFLLSLNIMYFVKGIDKYKMYFFENMKKVLIRKCFGLNKRKFWIINGVFLIIWYVKILLFEVWYVRLSRVVLIINFFKN